MLKDLADRLYAACNAPIRLSDRKTRVVSQVRGAKNKFPFVFDDEGNLDASLRPLVKKEFDRQTVRWEKLTRESNELMKESKFFETAEGITKAGS